ncbi:hypothetical protein LMZ02_07085 [Paenibacillus macerans]|nr:hypothetical protein [Paenibacillus macerans]UMV49116.1 hypothetical protein LMZ02_07085 [Paenibacillus macerans]
MAIFAQFAYNNSDVGGANFFIKKTAFHRHVDFLDHPLVFRQRLFYLFDGAVFRGLPLIWMKPPQSGTIGKTKPPIRGRLGEKG